MKKAVIIFLTFLYTVSTAGVTGSNFYCCGKFKETDLFSSFSSKKGCKEDKKDDNCCATKTFFVKVSDQHSLTERIKVTGSDLVKFVPAASSSLLSFQTTIAAPAFFTGNAPLSAHKPPLYLRNCSFLI